jgi:hypothetical protein
MGSFIYELDDELSWVMMKCVSMSMTEYYDTISIVCILFSVILYSFFHNP